jgi:AcrR family transcriptional regulator
MNAIVASTKTAASRQPRRSERAGQGGRAARTKAKIADAVITVLAEAGSSRLTHRLVAAAAGVPLAATTYHYATKREMIADASHRLLDGYVRSFQRAAERRRRGEGTTDLAGFVTKLLTNASGRHRRSALAWCEVILDAARSPEGHALADQWFQKLFEAWSDLARAMYGELGDDAVMSGVDTAIGLLFITLPLELSAAQLAAVFSGGGDPAALWAPSPPATDSNPPAPERRTRKARDTKARILQGAIDVLIGQGAGAVTYNAVAAASGLTTAAPAYHFGSIDGLLKAAEVELFARSKDRYRDMVTSVPAQGRPLDTLADLTTAVFVREVTQHGRAAIAIYSIGLESSRRLDLRPAVWSVIADQAGAWRRRLEMLSPGANAFDAMRMQAVFIGKQVRVLSTGSPLAQLALVRSAFRSEIASTMRSKGAGN